MHFPFLTNECRHSFPLHCPQMCFYYTEMEWIAFWLISPQRRFSKPSSAFFAQRDTWTLTCRTLIGQIQGCHCHVTCHLSNSFWHRRSYCSLYTRDCCLYHYCCCSGIVFPSRLVLNVPDSLFQLEEAEWALEPFFGVMGVDCELPSLYSPSQVMTLSIYIRFAWIMHWSHI